jgi:hypothetical protein
MPDKPPIRNPPKSTTPQWPMKLGYMRILDVLCNVSSMVQFPQVVACLMIAPNKQGLYRHLASTGIVFFKVPNPFEFQRNSHLIQIEFIADGLKVTADYQQIYPSWNISDCFINVVQFSMATTLNGDVWHFWKEFEKV